MDIEISDTKNGAKNSATTEMDKQFAIIAASLDKVKLWVTITILFLFLFAAPLGIGMLTWQTASESKVEFTLPVRNLICFPVFTFVEASLGIGFLVLTWASIFYYLKSDGLLNKKTKKEYPKDKTIFQIFAKEHKELSHVWFMISLAILCGSLGYVAFHVMETPCAAPWGFAVESKTVETSTDVWLKVVHFLPNFFLYTLFLLGYSWAIKNYNAHWHNSVTNEHRYASLVTIENIPNGSEAIKNQLALQAAAVVLMPSDSAYLEGQGEKEITAGERLLKIEEAIRAMLTHESKSRSESK